MGRICPCPSAGSGFLWSRSQGKPETSRGVCASKSIMSGAEGFVPPWAAKEVGSEVHGGAGAEWMSNSWLDATE